ncbi:hypothetical protein EMPS_06860 [Entomortierella parvispora]|uniref:F-box domain-containing protein n=1 Tax=Entomortierella parvispora TaxID=205924 RepID=A0A9P3HD81_9FUNG|nr:hypothetical protein EMPS_06860 [Entomortierella parvispora]
MQDLQDSSSPTRVLDSPELLILVARHLNKRQVLSCLQVCRTWHKALISLFWHDVFIMDNRCPRAPVLRKYADLVLRLIVHTEVFCWAPAELQEISLPRLQTLGVHQWNINEAPKELHAPIKPLIKLITRHQSSLTNLGLRHVTSQELMNAVVGCSQLEVLRIDYLQLESLDLWLQQYESFWSRLRSLTVGGPWFTKLEEDTSFTNPKLVEMLDANFGQSRLRSLDIRAVNKDILQIQSFLIQKSPELRDLRWRSTAGFEDHGTPLALMARSIQSGRFSQQLETMFASGVEFNNSDLKLVLESLKGLKTLDVQHTGFNVSSWLILKNEIPRYMTTLKSLSLAGCPHLTGKVIHDVLCSIESLETFHADYVKFSNLVEDERDWLCTGIKSLKMAIVMDGPQEEDDLMVMYRLSKLTRLELLDMRALCAQRTYNKKDVSRVVLLRGVMPTLARGLEVLEGLTRMRFFGVCLERGLGWRLDETMWALHYWPRLNELSGMKFYSSPVEICKKAGVRLTDCQLLL